MARKRITVAQWIKEALADGDKGKPCSALSLVYLKGMGHEEIHTRPIGPAPQDAAQLGEFFVSRATAYAQDLPGIQTFKMLAFYGQNEPQASFPFTVSEGELTAGGDTPFSKHEPTPTGLLGQLMKHNEVIMGMAVSLTQGYAVASMQREEGMRQEVNQAQEIVRDVIFSMKKEAHEQRMAELAFARTTNERLLIGKAIPSIINHLTGREVLPQDQADTNLIDALAMKVKPEHLQQLVNAGFIPAELGALLVARFAKAAEQRKSESLALQDLPPEGEEG